MAIQDSGYSAQRGILSPIDDTSDVAHGQRTSNALPHFPIAVVEDVLYDPENLTKEELDKLREKVSNLELVDRIPRNSIIATIISGEINKSNNITQIFLPCDMHDGKPIKPGEQVFVFYSDPYRSTQIGYWFCRVPQPRDTDDVNFTHADRRFEFNEGLSTADKASGTQISPPSFHNGDSLTEDSLTTSEFDDYDRINKEAKANKAIIKEPTARFTKRPGDKVIMGSNGTRVVLGQDRPGSAASPPAVESATIDLVATNYILPAEGETPEGSAPRVIRNARGELEVEKHPEKRNKKSNVNEGDPDFENDSSRIYISAKTNADSNFSIEVGDDGGEAPAIVLKTDQIRLVARQDLKIIVGAGSITIKSDGNMIWDPGPGGIIKLGGEDADKAILCNTGVNAGGQVGGTPILDTGGFASGLGNNTQGFFATKILIK